MIQDNFHIPSIYGYIIIVAAAIGGLWMSTSASKPQKVVVVQAPDISIHEAAYDGNIEAVKQHLAAGSDVNAKDNNELTPLHWAAREDRKEVAELLIAKRADVNARDYAGRTPLDSAAIIADSLENKDLLRKHGGKTGEELKAEGK